MMNMRSMNSIIMIMRSTNIITMITRDMTIITIMQMRSLPAGDLKHLRFIRKRRSRISWRLLIRKRSMEWCFARKAW